MIDFINKATLLLKLRPFLYKNLEGRIKLQHRPSGKGLVKEGYEKKVVACLVGLPKTAHSTIDERLKTFTREGMRDAPSSSEMFTYSSDHHLFVSNESSLENMRKRFHESEFSKAKRTMKNVLEKYSLTHDDVLYFSFVRNPFDQAYSAWREASGTWANDLDFQDFVEKCIDFYSNKKKPKDMAEASQLWHLRPQYENLLDEDNKIGTDFIFKFENIEEDYKTLYKLINKRAEDTGDKLIHRNQRRDSNERRNGSSIRFYNEKTIKLIKDFYKQDFLYFNY